MYKAFPEIGGIVHTHSSYATSWAQAGRDIPCYGTTHADYIYGEVPCLRCLTEQEINEAYEKNTGLLIVNEFKKMKKDIQAVPAVLCKNHGPFTWGKDGMEAVHNAVVLEECAKMAMRAELINPQVKPVHRNCRINTIIENMAQMPTMDRLLNKKDFLYPAERIACKGLSRLYKLSFFFV